MKTLKSLLILTSAMLIASGPALAQRHGHYGHRDHQQHQHRNYQQDRNSWAAMALVTGALLYGISRQQSGPEYVQPPAYVPPQAYYPPQPVYIERPAPVDYIERTVWFDDCSCYRKVFIQVR